MTPEDFLIADHVGLRLDGWYESHVSLTPPPMRLAPWPPSLVYARLVAVADSRAADLLRRARLQRTVVGEESCLHPPEYLRQPIQLLQDNELHQFGGRLPAGVALSRLQSRRRTA